MKKLALLSCSLALGFAPAAFADATFQCREAGGRLVASGSVKLNEAKPAFSILTVKTNIGPASVFDARSYSGYDYGHNISISGYYAVAPQTSKVIYEERVGAGKRVSTLRIQHRPATGDDKLHTLTCR